MPPTTYDATNDIYGPEGPPTVSSVIASAALGGGGGGAGSRVRVAGQGPQPATHGSRTITLDPTEADEEDVDPVHGVLDLTGESSAGRRVMWDDDVVDNEHMGKKKSKSKYEHRRSLSLPPLLSTPSFE